MTSGPWDAGDDSTRVSLTFVLPKSDDEAPEELVVLVELSDRADTGKALEIIDEVDVCWTGDDITVESAMVELMFVDRGWRGGCEVAGTVVCGRELTIVVTDDVEDVTDSDEIDVIRLLILVELFPMGWENFVTRVFFVDEVQCSRSRKQSMLKWAHSQPLILAKGRATAFLSQTKYMDQIPWYFFHVVYNFMTRFQLQIRSVPLYESNAKPSKILPKFPNLSLKPIHPLFVRRPTN